MPNCTSCGLPVPDGQGACCSMCYGDPWYGNDGYYMEQLIEHQRQDAVRLQEEQRQESLQEADDA